jgi:hypothetical protein
MLSRKLQRFLNCRCAWTRAIRLAGVALAGYYSTTILQASTVSAYLNGEVTSETISRTVDDGANWYQTNIGQFSFTHTGGDFIGSFQLLTFSAFCIEPREFVSTGGTYVYTWDTLENGATNIGGMGTAKADLLRELFGRYYPDFTMTVDPLHASALQIATWEIVREDSGGLDVYKGTTQYKDPQDQAALDLAQSYVQSLNGSGPILNNVFALTAIGTQDVIVQADPVVPEPVYSTLVGVLLVGFALARRRAA